MIYTSARSFLHHQVRNMVGALVYVGIGRWKVKHIAEVLEARDRRSGGPMAPERVLQMAAFPVVLIYLVQAALHVDVSVALEAGLRPSLPFVVLF